MFSNNIKRNTEGRLFKLNLAVTWQNRVQAIFNLAESFKFILTFISVNSVKRAES